jgi:hypothetical protein
MSLYTRRIASADTSLKTTEFVTNNMVIVPQPPYLLGLAPCDFALFSKFKMKLKVRCFETVYDIRNHYLTALKKIASTMLLEHEKNYKITAYIPKELLLSKLSQHLLVYLVRQLSKGTL